MIDSKGQTGLTFAAPEFAMKAAADNHAVGGWTAGVPFLTDFDRTIVQALRIRLTVADLLSQGTISGNAISYLVEGAMEGDFTTVAEAGPKPQIHFVNPTQVTDALKKIAGFIKMTDEFLEDADFLVSEINNRLLYRLGYFEEQQLLNGDGTGQNLTGLLNRAGIQTETAAGPTDNADALFRALTKIDVNSGLAPDGIVINPTDYQQLRLWPRTATTSTTAAGSSPASTARAACRWIRRCGALARWSPRPSPPGRPWWVRTRWRRPCTARAGSGWKPRRSTRRTSPATW
ncbi:phage major capsid protein [Mycolicibacterium farcinogenes]|nr:phage major capsid protein [Mycolicibacterium farcinogenes]